MTSDLIRPPEKRYGYRNALSGLVTLVKEEGFRGLSRGLMPNTVSSLPKVLPFLLLT
jgi:solute carrier family 25 (mitochondrial dicarboxylate transporter), member 10